MKRKILKIDMRGSLGSPIDAELIAPRPYQHREVVAHHDPTPHISLVTSLEKKTKEYFSSKLVLRTILPYVSMVVGMVCIRAGFFRIGSLFLILAISLLFYNVVTIFYSEPNNE